MSEHTFHDVSFNPHSGTGEIAVLFSGWGHPIPEHRIAPRVHEHFLIHTVLEGEGIFEQAGSSYRLNSGDTFVIFPDQVAGYEADRMHPWKYLWVGFIGSCGYEWLAALGITPEAPVIPHSNLPKLESLYRNLRQCLQKNVPPLVADLEASGWLRLLMVEAGAAKASLMPRVSSPPGQSNRQLELAIRMLTVQYNQTLSIDNLARTLGYHRAHLCRMFKEATGLSPSRYLSKIRMEKAEELLAGDYTIAQVAASVGYNDPLFFTRQFRKWRGMSPTEFRSGLR